MIELLFKYKKMELSNKAKENTILTYKNLYRDIKILTYFIEKLEKMKGYDNTILSNINDFLFEAIYGNMNSFIRDKDFYINLKTYIEICLIAESMKNIKKSDKVYKVFDKCRNLIIEKEYYYIKSLLEIKTKEMELHKFEVYKLRKILNLEKIENSYRDLEEKLKEN